ncbi:FMN-binding glutamate synthase family protein [Aquirhabdus sp.]|uniref:FMN-binding glutamate synthase family protein n=1 Tax=Aquirhabdus sp. TaxID=2824160 RepID=UPI00396C8F0A
MTDKKIAEHQISPTHKTRASPIARYAVWIIFTLFTILCIYEHVWWLALITGAFVVLGFRDRFQSHHAILRNYPIIGHMRFLFEEFRPEIRQYFIESDTDELPFSRDQRSLVYQRAKKENDTRAFGTISNLYEGGSEWMTQSIGAMTLKDHDFRIVIGGKDCLQPYSCSVFNISAMSFGALSANAIRALNRGAELGNFYHDTGEGSMSPYHLESKGDIVWEIASGYFGCRTLEGKFDPEEFQSKATNPQVKMIEIKISQGAKPGLGGLLPAGKVTPEIARTRGIPVAQDCVSPPAHTAFTTPRELIAFIKQLRDLSGGKPVGFKLCIGHPWEFMAIVKAMLLTDTYPDFIVVDGAEGGTGAADVEFMDHIGMPLRDGFLMVHNTLVGAGIRDKIRVGVSGKIISGFDVARMLALGADWCNSARGFMFALGCIQSRSCNTDRCPTGVATQDPYRQQALVVPDKAQRVKNFHEGTLAALAEIMGAVGVTHPDDLEPYHVIRRGPDGQIRLFSKHYYFLKDSSLITGEEQSDVYTQLWAMANPDTFNPNAGYLIPHGTESPANQRVELVSHS